MNHILYYYKVYFSFLLLLIFLVCFVFIVLYSSFGNPVSHSPLTCLGQLTSLMALGWEYDPKVARVSGDAQGEEEVQNQSNEQGHRAFLSMRNKSYFFLLNWKMMSLPCYHLGTACLRNKST